MKEADVRRTKSPKRRQNDFNPNIFLKENTSVKVRYVHLKTYNYVFSTLKSMATSYFIDLKQIYLLLKFYFSIFKYLKFSG